MNTNVLYYGDNLDILRKYIPDGSIDLVYLDPPFNSNATYNMIFRDESGNTTDAQIEAFGDIWHWGPDAASQYMYLTNTAYHQGKVPSPVSDLIGAFHSGIKPSPMLAYLVEMAVRLVELRRVLKPTGSLYLHCDPTASHYLKLVLDAIFDARSFRNEVVWQRTAAKGDARRKYGSVHDVILVYGKSGDAYFQPARRTADAVYLARFRLDDNDGRGPYRLAPLDSPNPRPNLTYEYKGFQPPRNGWRVSRELMEQLDAEDRLAFPKDATGRIARKHYLREQEPPNVGDVWTDISPLQAASRERLGWDTQKPLPLLERIIESSSKPGDIVLDPFCGCGTALVAAQKLGRQWIGIDITYLAIAVMQARLKDSFGIDVQIEGSPTEVEGARKLAQQLPNGREQFELWALTLVGAMPQGGVQKKGADKGVDGVITFTGAGGKLETCIVSVKSGHVTRTHVAELKGDMGSQSASMGLFVTLAEPTAPMRLEATEAGFYHSDISGKDYPAVQIITIRELLEEGRKPNLPLLVLSPYQQAQPIKKAADQAEMFGS